jgi:hypothetical protein
VGIRDEDVWLGLTLRTPVMLSKGTNQMSKDWPSSMAAEIG